MDNKKQRLTREEIYSNKKTARISIFHKKNTDSGSFIPGELSRHTACRSCGLLLVHNLPQ